MTSPTCHDAHSHAHNHETHGHTHDHEHEEHEEHQGHDHDHHDHHDHTPTVTDQNERRIFWALFLTAAFMIVEIIGGLVSGSLALLADAGHMLTDAAALGLAWLAFRIGRKPADLLRSYGYHRFQILASFANGLALFALAIWIMAEAVGRLYAPAPVEGLTMLLIAPLGLAVNGICFWILSRGDKENLNLQGAALHVMGDLLGSLAAIAAGVIIMTTGWTPIDPILSVLVAVLILRSAGSMVKKSAHILLEGTPKGLEATHIQAVLSDIPHVLALHHVHAWSLTHEHTLVTLHIVATPAVDTPLLLKEVSDRLRDRLGVHHTTIQIEPAGFACPAPAECATCHTEKQPHT